MISFIIVNYNSKELTSAAVESIARSVTNTPYEIIVADNRSTDGSKEFFEKLAQSSENIQYIYCEKNHGFGGANNIAAKCAQGSCLVLINPDTQIPSVGFDDFVLKCLDPEIGVLAPKVVYENGSVQANGGGYSTIFTFIFQNLRLGYYSRKWGLIGGFAKIVGWFPFLKGTIIGKYLGNFQPQSPIVSSYDWVSGSCMIMRRSVFEQVGGFDDDYFMYVEDEDLCRRIKAMGLEIQVNRSFTIVHAEGGTQRKHVSKLGAAQRARYFSNLRYLGKFNGKVYSLFLRFYYVLSFTINSLTYLLRLKPAVAIDRLEFTLSFLRPRRD